MNLINSTLYLWQSLEPTSAIKQILIKNGDPVEKVDHSLVYTVAWLQSLANAAKKIYFVR